MTASYPQAAAGLPADITAQVARALAEDVGAGDVTARLVPAGQQVQARVLAREPAIVCGQAWVDEVYRQLDPAVSVSWQARDGEQVDADSILCRVSGPARAVLTGERSALNFLQTLSATATETRRYVDAVAGTRCRILDTRKTLPGLREAQKYAVRCGGGRNHRMGLYDMVLIKENHILAAGSIAAAVDAARRLAPGITVEVEVESLAELDQALAAGADLVMLDELSLEDMREAVRRRDDRAARTQLEASGGVALETVRRIAATGVDFVSIGGLTKHVAAIDLSMRIEFVAGDAP
ncbi:MAG: carboxylating nicotinate-nucleotide diphosphorylase [Sinobacteraceae bacterium]|nr:carboxylating nicotinate-nucleotide diphosphorylase [Nevskiaceae bacterium]MCP5339004.1 carboxylating nicotinate-nucleotide diphosphorylase [Nevskiaceae bacterium]MCP5359584.1 carboxylating nicotinate-nucleotide diphosphorylase [Nevskiaceae bacterium]MCP5472623.1 carboxylating nicotinate-nucleotide diphosphorylase [Nevskiaceae bacterium]